LDQDGGAILSQHDGMWQLEAPQYHGYPSAVTIAKNQKNVTTDGSEGQEKGELVILAAGPGYDVCEYCSIRPAEIFQVTGNFCIICWQELTHPNV
jgi:hypothetical protein